MEFIQNGNNVIGEYGPVLIAKAKALKGVRKASNGTLYVIYPDGSWRRVSERVNKGTKRSRRGRRRNEAAAVRFGAFQNIKIAS